MNLYKVTTRYRTAVTRGVRHTAHRGECTADAMRAARDELLALYAVEVEVTGQDARPDHSIWAPDVTPGAKHEGNR